MNLKSIFCALALLFSLAGTTFAQSNDSENPPRPIGTIPFEDWTDYRPEPEMVSISETFGVGKILYGKLRDFEPKPNYEMVKIKEGVWLEIAPIVFSTQKKAEEKILKDSSGFVITFLNESNYDVDTAKILRIMLKTTTTKPTKRLPKNVAVAHYGGYWHWYYSEVFHSLQEAEKVKSEMLEDYPEILTPEDGPFIQEGLWGLKQIYSTSPSVQR
jgi:hypothetical protein